MFTFWVYFYLLLLIVKLIPLIDKYNARGFRKHTLEIKNHNIAFLFLFSINEGHYICVLQSLKFFASKNLFNIYNLIS